MKDFFKNIEIGQKIIIGTILLAIVLTIVIHTGVDVTVRGLNE